MGGSQYRKKLENDKDSVPPVTEGQTLENMTHSQNKST